HGPIDFTVPAVGSRIENRRALRRGEPVPTPEITVQARGLLLRDEKFLQPIEQDLEPPAALCIDEATSPGKLELHVQAPFPKEIDPFGQRLVDLPEGPDEVRLWCTEHLCRRQVEFGEAST